MNLFFWHLSFTLELCHKIVIDRGCTILLGATPWLVLKTWSFLHRHHWGFAFIAAWANLLCVYYVWCFEGVDAYKFIPRHLPSAHRCTRVARHMWRRTPAWCRKHRVGSTWGLTPSTGTCCRGSDCRSSLILTCCSFLCHNHRLWHQRPPLYGSRIQFFLEFWSPYLWYIHYLATCLQCTFGHRRYNHDLCQCCIALQVWYFGWEPHAHKGIMHVIRKKEDPRRYVSNLTWLSALMFVTVNEVVLSVYIIELGPLWYKD
jgi:hypothetical protein